MARWSKNIVNPPKLLPPEEVGELRDRAYPFEDTDAEKSGERYIMVSAEAVLFRGQRGPIKEVGVNGCQIDDIITFAAETIKAFNAKFPCRENSLAITDLESALNWLDRRRRDREDRGVEGMDKA